MTRKTVLVAILILGLLASLFIAAQRVRVESRNRAVELVVDYGDIAQITAATGKPPVEVLRSLKRSGLTSVAIAEQTVGDLAEGGELRYDEENGRFTLARAVVLRVMTCLRAAMGPLNVRVLSRGSNLSVGLRTPLPFAYVKQLPAGLAEDAVASTRRAGLEVIARLVNYPGAEPFSIDWLVWHTKQQGIDKIIFQGDQVLGFKGAVKDTARAFKKYGLIFGRVEFAKQKGETELAERAQANVIAVHSITQNEMPALTESAIVDRFQKAVRERGVRICYIRMYDTASADLLRANCDYVRKIARAITAAGYTLKSSDPLEEVCAPTSARMQAGAGVAAGAILLLLLLVDLSATASMIWSIAALVLCYSLPAAGDMGRKAVGLLAAFIFPTLAALWAVRGAPESPTAGPRMLLRAVGRLLGAVAITVAGGVLIVGLLSSRAFMLRIDQFMGIKAAHLVPILVLAGAFAGGIAWRSDTWSAQKQRLRESYARLLESPVLMWQAIGLLAVIVLIGLMVARSGNEAGLEVSSIELRLRSILDRVLVVRPRTKEFLIGYPLLLVGIAFALRGARRWAAILVTIGSIGLISALNTFCHIHTPLAVTALRTLNGLVIGTIIGLVAYWLLRRYTHKGIM